MPPPLSSADGDQHAALPVGVTPSARRGRGVGRVVMLVVGGTLLIAAVAVVVRHWPALGASIETARGAPVWMIGLALAAPLANIAAVGLSFLVLTGRYGRVGAWEMIALITSAWMLNMLPLRPGLIGRIGYHKSVNKIAVRHSVVVLFHAIGCNAAAMGMALLAALASARLGLGAWGMTAALALPACVLGALGWAAWAMGVGNAWPGLAAQPWRWLIATALRYVDIAVWIGRYALAFAILGAPLTLVGSTVTALASEAAMLSPVQVGLREWVVGVTSAAFATEAAGGLSGAEGGAVVARGLLADLLNRGIEIAVALPTGLAASIWLIARYRRSTGRVAEVGARPK